LLHEITNPIESLAEQATKNHMMIESQINHVIQHHMSACFVLGHTPMPCENVAGEMK
jgi:hypothetical protein